MLQADEIAAALLRGGVDFIIIGGLAVGAHGFVRATKDIDIVPSPAADNLQRLAKVLRELDAVYDRTEMFGMTVRLCSREDLITMKRAAGRPQDVIDLERLGAA